jgi:hypothetical protein
MLPILAVTPFVVACDEGEETIAPPPVTGSMTK